jgi:Protein of unknown function (DUF2934)
MMSRRLIGEKEGDDMAEVKVRPAAYVPEPQLGTLSVAERVRQRAYELYVERSRQPGKALEDWLRAETETRRAEEDAFVDEYAAPAYPPLAVDAVDDAKWCRTHS